MVQVTLIVVGEKTHVVTAHWREIKHHLMTLPLSMSESTEYILIDLNRKLLINAQQAFALPRLPIEKIDL